MTVRLPRWLIAFALAIAGTTFVVAPATAVSSGYCTGPGVNVVVDSGALGAGIRKGCGQGSLAHAAFDSAGFPLGEISTGGMNGFVCTVSINGTPYPMDRHCTGMNGQGYWALFVASPGGSWTYANVGADSLSVSDGQTVSFAWQAPGSGQRDPGTAPAPRVRPPAPKPTPTSVRKSISSSSSASPRPAASPSAKTSASPSPSPQATTGTSTPTPSPSSPAYASNLTITHPATKPSSGLPWWIPTGVVLILALGAAGTWWRKRTGG